MTTYIQEFWSETGYSIFQKMDEFGSRENVDPATWASILADQNNTIEVIKYDPEKEFKYLPYDQMIAAVCGFRLAKLGLTSEIIASIMLNRVDDMINNVTNDQHNTEYATLMGARAQIIAQAYSDYPKP